MQIKSPYVGTSKWYVPFPFFVNPLLLITNDSTDTCVGTLLKSKQLQLMALLICMNNTEGELNLHLEKHELLIMEFFYESAGHFLSLVTFFIKCKKTCDESLQHALECR